MSSVGNETITHYEKLVDECLELIDYAEHQYEQLALNKTEFERRFNGLALRIFAYQFQYNIVFQAFCRQKGKTPRTVSSWREIPAVPLQAFKQSELSCTDPGQARALFMTSGTTNKQLRGKHFHPSLRLYDASMRAAFKWNVIDRSNNSAGKDQESMHPSTNQESTDQESMHQKRLKLIVLFPTAEELPHSSLAHYLHLAVEHFGREDSHYVVNEQGLNEHRLLALLKEAIVDQQPILLLGATFSYVHAFDQLRQLGCTFKLPAGSKLLDTGGTKGRSREIEQEMLYGECEELLGISRNNCINMYGMTELSTQFYDNGMMKRPGEKFGPPWIRTRAVDPLTGKEMPRGEAGLLVHCDLANLNSVTAILTEDVGYITEDDGFVLLGRAEGSAAKGCSLVMEEFVNASSFR